MDQQENYQKWGTLSGIISASAILFIIPILIAINPEFSTSLSGFDPLSQLSSTKTTEIYYRTLLISCGILTFTYFELSFIPNRSEYAKLYNWKLSKIFLRIGVSGQILTGIFDETIFPQHLFATILFAIGYIGGITMISFDLANQTRNKGKLLFLINAGFIISILATLNTLYFRYSPIRGIWQYFILLLTILWYIFEAMNYPKYEVYLSENIVEDEIIEMTKYTYIMLFVGIYLIIFAYLLHNYPKMEPWSCKENDRKCDLSNVYSLVVVGSIILLFLGIYRFKTVRKLKTNSIRI